MTMTPEQLREEAAAIERMHGETLTVEWRLHMAELLRSHAAALEEIERLNAAWKAQQFHLEAEERESAHWQERAEKAEAALAAQSVKLKADEIAWHEQEEAIRDLRAERDALKRHAEAMATTLDDWSRIDQCPCVALDNYRAEFKGE